MRRSTRARRSPGNARSKRLLAVVGTLVVFGGIVAVTQISSAQDRRTNNPRPASAQCVEPSPGATAPSGSGSTTRTWQNGRWVRNHWGDGQQSVAECQQVETAAAPRRRLGHRLPGRDGQAPAGAGPGAGRGGPQPRPVADPDRRGRPPVGRRGQQGRELHPQLHPPAAGQQAARDAGADHDRGRPGRAPSPGSGAARRVPGGAHRKHRRQQRWKYGERHRWKHRRQSDGTTGSTVGTTAATTVETTTAATMPRAPGSAYWPTTATTPSSSRTTVSRTATGA